MAETKADSYLTLIHRHLPQFLASQARILPSNGQFNVVVCVDDRWIFRFPKSEQAAADLAHELEILPRLQGRLPLPIPAPEYSATDSETGKVLFMGYAMLPGEPLLRQRYRELQQDCGVIERIAHDLARFLRTLHRIPPSDIGLDDKGEDARDAWTQHYRDFRDKLFPYMRIDARREVERDFEEALNGASLWRYDACLTHGDFGSGNILYRGGRISGIIDFSFCGPGDPAQDLGALIASYGEGLVERVFFHFPALRQHRRRARFCRGQYALIQALYALRDNDEAEFEDGIADYR